jgi:hypothetical protein
LTLPDLEVCSCVPVLDWKLETKFQSLPCPWLAGWLWIYLFWVFIFILDSWPDAR